VSLRAQSYRAPDERAGGKGEPMKKTYLGDSLYTDDSVYADLDGYGITLTTENVRNEPSNIIYLEPQVLAALDDYRAYLKKQLAEEPT